MALAKIPVPPAGATVWTDFVVVVEKQRLGFSAISLTNVDNANAPAIASGSVIEISGALYMASSNESVSGTPTTGRNYIRMEVLGSNATPVWSSTAPAWNNTKNGWYDGTGAYRYVAECDYDGTNYLNKRVLAQFKETDLFVMDRFDRQQIVSRDAIGAGNPVGLVNDGLYVKPIMKIAGDILHTISNATVYNDCCWLGDNYVVVCFQHGTTCRARVAQWDESTETWSWATAETTLFTNGTSGSTLCLCESFMSGYKWVVIGYCTGSTPTLAVCQFNSGAGTISILATTALVGTTSVYGGLVAIRSNGEFCYGRQLSNVYYARVGHESGGSIVWDTVETTISTMGGANTPYLTVLDSEYNILISGINASSYPTSSVFKWDPSSPGTLTIVDTNEVWTSLITGAVMPFLWGDGEILGVAAATKPRVSKLLFSRQGSFLSGTDLTMYGIGQRETSAGTPGMCAHGARDQFVMKIGNTSSPYTTQWFTGKCRGRGIEYAGDFLSPRNTIRYAPSPKKYKTHGCFIDSATISATELCLYMVHVPRIVGVAEAAISSGGAGIIQRRGKLSTLSGLVPGKSYGVNYYTGNIVSPANQATVLYYALTSKEALLVPENMM